MIGANLGDEKGNKQTQRDGETGNVAQVQCLRDGVARDLTQRGGDDLGGTAVKLGISESAEVSGEPERRGFDTECRRVQTW